MSLGSCARWNARAWSQVDSFMPVARMPGDSIAGDKITYGFGSVVPSQDGGRRAFTFKNNGQAFVVKRWSRRTPQDVPPIPNPAKFDQLDAATAKGFSDSWQEDGKHHKGSHREKTGVLKGNASVTVTAPRAQVGHRQ